MNYQRLPVVEEAKALGTTEDFLLWLESAWPYEIWVDFFLRHETLEKRVNSLKSAPLIRLWKCEPYRVKEDNTFEAKGKDTFGQFDSEGNKCSKAQAITGEVYTQEQLPTQGQNLITAINQIDHQIMQENSKVRSAISQKGLEAATTEEVFMWVNHFRDLNKIEEKKLPLQYQLTQMYWMLHRISRGFTYEADGYKVTAIHSPDWIAGEARIEKEGKAAIYGRVEVEAFFKDKKSTKFRDSLEEIGGIYEVWKNTGNLCN